MLLIEWRDEFSVGIPSLDEQHHKLVNMLNALNDAIEQEKGDRVLVEIFEGLVVYTEKHFTYEESLLEEYGYPSHEKHQKEHAVLRNQVDALRKRFDAGEEVITVLLLDFLKMWLEEHILRSDKEYSAFLVEKGAV